MKRLQDLIMFVCAQGRQEIRPRKKQKKLVKLAGARPDGAASLVIEFL